jgi:hypothetical protein
MSSWLVVVGIVAVGLIAGVLAFRRPLDSKPREAGSGDNSYTANGESGGGPSHGGHSGGGGGGD